MALVIRWLNSLARSPWAGRSGLPYRMVMRGRPRRGQLLPGGMAL